MSEARSVTVYRSSNVRDMYVFVASDCDPLTLPEALLARFGRPVEAMQLELSQERRLARADAKAVLANIDEHGYYLQLPPAAEEWDLK